jgi:hypothetical protein
MARAFFLAKQAEIHVGAACPKALYTGSFNMRVRLDGGYGHL